MEIFLGKSIKLCGALQNVRQCRKKCGVEMKTDSMCVGEPSLTKEGRASK